MFISTRLPPYTLGSRLLPQAQKALDTFASRHEQLLVLLFCNTEAQLCAVQNMKADQCSSTSWLAVQVW